MPRLAPLFLTLGLIGAVAPASSQQSMLEPPDTHYFVSEGSWGQKYPDQWALKRIGFDSGADSAWRLVKSAAEPVVVAVIDTGLDWNHKNIDWKNIWHNPKEIAGNDIDDDNNGYVDDIIGWDFSIATINLGTMTVTAPWSQASSPGAGTTRTGWPASTHSRG